jgi:shikimate dehydrogenase
MSNTETQDFYCVLGNPISHSRSPAIHARFAELTGQQLVYERRLLALHDFAGQLNALREEMALAQPQRRFLGCNVTVPFKLDAAKAAGRQTERVALARASNTLHWDGYQWCADNTDGLGLVRDVIHNAGYDVAARSILILGAGGAAAGVLAPLLQTLPLRVVIANRTLEKAQSLVQGHQRLAETLGVHLQATDLLALKGEFDLVINGTTTSLQGQALHLPGVRLRAGSLAYDMMYGPNAQPFLTWATEQGARGRDGLGMLVEQAAESFHIWRGIRPPAAVVLQEMREALP